MMERLWDSFMTWLNTTFEFMFVVYRICSNQIIIIIIVFNINKNRSKSSNDNNIQIDQYNSWVNS